MKRERLEFYGSWFRFLTPILITISLFILGMLRADILDLKMGFANHLEHHRKHEIMLEGRLATIETLMKGIK